MIDSLNKTAYELAENQTSDNKITADVINRNAEILVAV